MNGFSATALPRGFGRSGPARSPPRFARARTWRRRIWSTHVGSSGRGSAPHLHFQVTDSLSFADATGLPFVFDTQRLEGSVSEDELVPFLQGAPVTLDRTGAGARDALMPARNGVFGHNLFQ